MGSEATMNSIASSFMTFEEALDDISNSYLQDVDRVIGLEAFQFAKLLSDWWYDKLDIFSLIMKIYAFFAEKSALKLLYGFNDVLRLKGFLPKLHCSLNNDEDDFIAIIDSNGSRIYLLSQFSLQSPTWMFSTEGLTNDGLITLASRLDKETARWAIQLLHIELKLRYLEIPARRICMKALHRLVQNFHVLPPSLFLRDVVPKGQHPVNGGGYADIFEGNLEELGRKEVPVCLKALRVFQVYGTEERDKLLKEFCREAFLWTQLNHQNILPCFGVSMDAIDGRLCLVSPWMANGNIMEFLKLNPQYDRLKAIIGVAQGLAYLHGLEPQLVHGDIKGVNILVTEDEHCCLADFGLCAMAETRTIGVTTTSFANKGTLRWLAPELLNPTDPKFHVPNKAARDIYAFACTILEIYTGKPPFADKMDVPVMFDVLQGRRPGRPNEMGMPSLNGVWELMEECWIEDSYRRPQAKELVQRLEDPRDSPSESRDLAIERERDLAVVPMQRIASPASLVRDANPNPVILADLDRRTLPQDLRTEGSDWSCIFNPSLPPQALLDPKKRKNLDISLLLTLNHDSVVWCVQFSPDGKYLATGCDRTAQIFDANGEKVCVLIDETRTSSNLYIRDVRFSPDGRYLATGGGDKQTRIWDIAQKKIVVTFSGHTDWVYTLGFTPDSKYIVSGSRDGTARIWNLQPFIVMPDSPQLEGPPEDPNDPRWCTVLTAGDSPDAPPSSVTSVSVSPDGRYLAAGSYDCLVRIWDINTGQLLERLHEHHSYVYSVVFAPNGKGVISGSLDRTMKYWDVSWLYAHSVTPEDRGKCLMNFVGHKGSVFSVAMSHDSQWIVSGSEDGGVQFWDSRNAHVQCMLGQGGWAVQAITLSPVGNLLATGSSDGTARIWKYTTS